jgi:hypothetical protein
MLAVPRRPGFALVALLALSVPLTGCVQEVGCAAIGWQNRLAVTVTGARADAVDVELCVDSSCVPRDDRVDAFGGAVTVSHTGASWVFTAFVYPSTFEVRAYATDGAEVAHVTVTPRWSPNFTGPCPGPSAATVELPT